MSKCEACGATLPEDHPIFRMMDVDAEETPTHDVCEGCFTVACFRINRSPEESGILDVYMDDIRLIVGED